MEYGSGTGNLSIALKDSLGHITLADSVPGMLEVVKDKISASTSTKMTPFLLDLERPSACRTL